MHFCISSSVQRCHVCCLHLSHISPGGQMHHLYDTTSRQVQLPQFLHHMFLSWKAFSSSTDAHFNSGTTQKIEASLVSLITRSVVQLCIKGLEWVFHCYWVLIVFRLHIAACKWKLPRHGDGLISGISSELRRAWRCRCDDTFPSPPGVNLVIASKSKWLILTMTLLPVLDIFCNSKVPRRQKALRSYHVPFLF